jgi:2-polyprenyl-3-methyl-5-hydroxy-6-metoxy-1,4-benzoquinol methylase
MDRRTVESYEHIADEYARETADNDFSSGSLARLAASIPSGHVLEIGSGPGWDADALEDAGLRVRRTDAAQAFVDFQQSRGKEAGRLDAIADDFGGPYDAVVAIAVLQHVPPDDLPGVLAKVAESLRPGGKFLVTVPLGHGVDWEVGKSGNRYYRALWSEDDFIAALTRVGLMPEWTDRSGDNADSGWLTVLAQLSDPD